MDKEWSNKNKEIQFLLSKKITYKEGIDKLISFRDELLASIKKIVDSYPNESFYMMPFKNKDGYHSKSLAYSIWHIFRIEDIVAHEMILNDTQVLFQNDYLNKINSNIITTGNELSGDEIEEFSKRLNVKELYNYAEAVKNSTDNMLKGLSYEDFKKTFDDSMKLKLQVSKCVSDNDEAIWLIDYWTSKNILGLIKMPFSRHWIMHIEAMIRITSKL